ncbi:MAG: tRNA (N6-isopentenyl adenosine(37)-C2)-methylthiotransferase MiaB [Candidatus Omnitrophica bacterium]|nr:tRNA (N6-isopentenyl adenosine(37)-C2)-methylthiotransferase MiaB [Candidatus Omnitrophota bacterium]MDD5512313.1 tRNA (N6-isopentenyl adenosine(37)-C2)-methylthiotransferase MiaB [Candidatus Omnitrophota bacterium]
MNKKHLYIRTYGCQMNVRDSEVVAGLLKAEGYKLTDDPASADVVIINTCSVRELAEQKAWSEIGRIAKKSQVTSHKSQVKPLIGIIGCMAQNYKESIFQRAPEVDFVVGPTDIAKIPGIINELVRGSWSVVRGPALFERKIWETGGQNRPEEIYHSGFYADKEHAFVVISEGCSNFCSYCVVPYVRGPLRHRNCEDIIAEIRRAIEQGITRVTLLGQNVNAYRSSLKRKAQSAKLQRKVQNDREVGFVDLLRKVNQIKGLKEFSFVTSHPKDTSIELFQAMAELKKLKKYLHLPVQSGADRILKAMNRGYTRKFYLELAHDYRRIVKGGQLTTDIIVGFPSETKEEFKETYELVKEADFDASFIFKYSPRPHSAAAAMADDVEKREKERRHKLILDLQKSISRKKRCAKD